MLRSKRARRAGWATAATGLLATVLTGAAPTAHAARTAARASAGVAKWHSAYADGTGNSAVGDLNDAQLNGHYTGPYYDRGQPAPPARAVTLGGAGTPRGAAPDAVSRPAAPQPLAAPPASVLSPQARPLPPPQPLGN